MALGILGRKIGMTQVYDAEGNMVPVTVVEAGPCTVLQVRTKDKDGYESFSWASQTSHVVCRPRPNGAMWRPSAANGRRPERQPVWRSQESGLRAATVCSRIPQGRRGRRRRSGSEDHRHRLRRHHCRGCRGADEGTRDSRGHEATRVRRVAREPRCEAASPGTWVRGVPRGGARRHRCDQARQEDDRPLGQFAGYHSQPVGRADRSRNEFDPHQGCYPRSERRLRCRSQVEQEEGCQRREACRHRSQEEKGQVIRGTERDENDRRGLVFVHSRGSGPGVFDASTRRKS